MMKVTGEGLKKIEMTIGFDSLEFDTSLASREVRFISGGTCVAKMQIPYSFREGDVLRLDGIDGKTSVRVD